MKRLLCLLAATAVLAACGQKTTPEPSDPASAPPAANAPAATGTPSTEELQPPVTMRCNAW
jgi:hypothetical protein